jgi:hypothetical protein
MAFAGNASGRWNQLDALRRGFITRCELYASYTLPKLCLPDGYDQNSSELSHDFQAVGAQSVNHLANKIMLAGFAPSRPFFRLDATPAVEAEIKELGAAVEDIAALLAKGEKAAVKELDGMAMRPKLYEVIKHLIVIGNVLLCLEKDTARVIGIKKYCVRRSASGKLLELMIADKVLFDELEPAVQDTVRRFANYPDDRVVTLYRWIKRNAVGDYEMEQWVDTYKLPKQFSGKWPEEKLPYRVLTWDLSDDAHYGTGLVEDYKGDFAGLSTLSKAQVIGAVLASEFRWLCNPAGLTKPEDLESSENGAVIPGAVGDITLIESSKSQDLQVTLNMSAEYVTRIGRGFLLGTAMVRDAERVTAEEIRMQANELETSLGGAYSRIAVDLQLPMARWLMAMIGLGTNDKQFRISIVTGLEALSRTGDLEDLKLWLADLAALAGLPPTLLAAMKFRPLAQALAAPRRVDTSAYLKSDEELAAEQAAARSAEQETMAAQAGNDIAVNAASNAPPPQGTPA